jgi:hypothetical protein
MDPRPIIAVITDIKDEEVYELGWWTRIQKMQLFKEVYHKDMFV